MSYLILEPRKKFDIVIFLLASLAIMAAFAMSSCVTQKRCQELYPAVVKDSIRIKDSVSIREISVFIPRDSIVFKDSIPCKDFVFDLSEKKNNLTASLHIAKGKVSFKCAEDSLRAVIEEREHFISTIDRSVKVEFKTEYISHWYTVPCYWIAGLSLMYLIIVLVIWILKKFYGR